MNIVFVLIGAIVVYLVFLRNDLGITEKEKKAADQRAAEDRQLLKEGPDAAKLQAIITELLKKAGNPRNLREQLVCVPKYDTGSHDDGRAPLIQNEGESCGKSGEAKGFILTTANGDVFFGWTGGYYLWNFNRIVDANKDVAYFVTDHRTNMKSAFDFRKGKFLKGSQMRPMERKPIPGGLEPNSGAMKALNTLIEIENFSKRVTWPQ